MAAKLTPSEILNNVYSTSTNTIATTATISGGGDATAANQTTQITAEQAILATAGAISGAAVVTDANGTIQQYLRGIVKLLIGTLIMGGDTANAATDAGNPVKIGGIAKTSTPTAVTDAQRVNAWFSKTGKQVTEGNIRENKGVTQTQISNSTAETTIVAAVSAVFCDLYGLVLANTGATTTKVTIKDATSGTTRAIIEVPTLETRGFMLPVDSGIPQGTVNNNWTATCASATTALEVTALWVKNI